MKFLWFIIAFISLVSCQDIEEVKEPKNLIPEEKMVDVLTDLAILNAAKNYNKKMLEAKGVRPDEYLYNKHKIDSIQLVESTHYYAKNFNRLEIIFERVQRNLENMKQDYEQRQEEEEKEDTLEASAKELFDSITQDPNRRRRLDRDSIMNPAPAAGKN